MSITSQSQNSEPVIINLRLYCTLIHEYFEIGTYCSYKNLKILYLFYFVILYFSSGLNLNDHRYDFEIVDDSILHHLFCFIFLC